MRARTYTPVMRTPAPPAPPQHLRDPIATSQQIVDSPRGNGPAILTLTEELAAVKAMVKQVACDFQQQKAPLTVIALASTPVRKTSAMTDMPR